MKHNNGGIIIMVNILHSGEDDDADIVFVFKKSDIKRFVNGKANICVNVYKGIMSNLLEDSDIPNHINGENNIKLTTRQLEVLKYIVQGKNNLKIAEELCVSRHTIKAHVANILHKLDVDDRYQAAIKAINEKII